MIVGSNHFTFSNYYYFGEFTLVVIVHVLQRCTMKNLLYQKMEFNQNSVHIEPYLSIYYERESLLGTKQVSR